MSNIEDTDTPKDRKFVEALSRGLDVLRAFTHGSVVMATRILHASPGYRSRRCRA